MLAFSFVAIATLWMPSWRFHTAAVCTTKLVPYGSRLVLTRRDHTARCRVIGSSRALLVSPDVRAALGSGTGPLRVRVFEAERVPECRSVVRPIVCQPTACVAQLPRRSMLCGSK